MKKFIIMFGLGGGFNSKEYQVVMATSMQDAEHQAWQAACDEYESYAGLHGLRDVDQIMEEEGIDDYEEANEVFAEERENWLDYRAMEYNDANVKKVKDSGNNFHDPYEKK